MYSKGFFDSLFIIQYGAGLEVFVGQIVIVCFLNADIGSITLMFGILALLLQGKVGLEVAALCCSGCLCLEAWMV